MKIVYVPIAKIQPYSGNPRKNDDAVKYVSNSIKKFGFRNPIILDKNNVIIAGHTRYKAAKSLNMSDVPCIIAGDLNDEQVKALRIADNKTSEMSEWDNDLLSIELSEIFNIDMSDFGFDFNVPIDVEEDDYEVVIPEQAKSKLGEIYRLGNHRLMCGDSTKEDDVQKLMNGELADIIFTDPPWNVDYGGSNNPKWRQRNDKIINDDMETEDFKEFMISVFKNMNDASKPGCMVYLVMSAQEWGNLMLTMADAGYHWSSTIIWNKNVHVIGRKDYHTKYEPIYYGWKDGAPRLHPMKDRTQCDVWDIPKPQRSDEHPTMKPIQLVAKALQNSSEGGGEVHA